MITLLQGDITQQRVDAIVNAANESLRGGGGVDGAIHRAAGPQLLEECLKIGGCKTGEAVITGAGKLEARYVIHTPGPVWHGGAQDEAALLRRSYTHSFQAALEHGVRTIAFPAISTGVYHFPKLLAAQIALETAAAFEAQFQEIRMVCFSRDDLLIYRRIWMVESQIRRRGVRDEKVLGAMRRVPRHLFVDATQVQEAYDDHPLPIAGGQTISQPYIVASMTELLGVHENSHVLEIGTGCGYQTAVLAEIAAAVSSVEIIPALSQTAGRLITEIGYHHIQLRIGDGHLGWEEHAPFDGILVTAAPDEIPPALIAQLKPGARLVIPVGAAHGEQELHVIEKDAHGHLHSDRLYAVRFVPLRRA